MILSPPLTQVAEWGVSAHHLPPSPRGLSPRRRPPDKPHLSNLRALGARPNSAGSHLVPGQSHDARPAHTTRTLHGPGTHCSSTGRLPWNKTGIDINLIAWESFLRNNEKSRRSHPFSCRLNCRSWGSLFHYFSNTWHLPPVIGKQK